MYLGEDEVRLVLFALPFVRQLSLRRTCKEWDDLLWREWIRVYHDSFLRYTDAMRLRLSPRACVSKRWLLRYLRHQCVVPIPLPPNYRCAACSAPVAGVGDCQRCVTTSPGAEEEEG